MGKFNERGRAVRAALGLALMAAIASVTGSSSAGSDDELRACGGNTPRRPPVQAVFRCTMAGGTVDGALVIYDDNSCVRVPQRVPIASNYYCRDGVCPACWPLAEDLGCFLTN